MKNIIALVLLLQFTAALSQQKGWVVVKKDSLHFKADAFVGVDSFGAEYFISDNNFYKLKGKVNLQYKNLSLGKISRADIHNPLSILLFYESFNTAVLLDDQLNETRKISFSQNDVPIVATAVGLAYGNRLWVYNSLTQQIGLLDYLQSDLKTITVPFAGTMKYYDSDGNYFQWIDDKGNGYRSDIYGKISTLGKIADFDQLQFISDTEILYQKAGVLKHYNLKDGKTSIIDVREKTFKSFYYKDQILSIFTPPSITNYKIQIP